MNRIQSKEHRQKLMKLPNIYCLVSMTEYIFKTKDIMDQLLFFRVNYKNAVILITIQKSFCEPNCFNFQSNHDRFFAKHIKFEKRKISRKR